MRPVDVLDGAAAYLLGHVGYRAVMAAVGLWVTSRRLGTLLTS